MKSFNITLVALATALTLAACEKKQEPAVVTPAAVSIPASPIVAPTTPVTTSESVTTDQKK